MAKMSFLNLLFCLLLSCTELFAASPPTVTDSAHGVTYIGAAKSGVEQFLNIRFGQDTGGINRFKHPQAYTYASGTTVKATKLGPACPAKTLQSLFGFTDNGGVDITIRGLFEPEASSSSGYAAECRPPCDGLDLWGEHVRWIIMCALSDIPIRVEMSTDLSTIPCMSQQC